MKLSSNYNFYVDPYFHKKKNCFYIFFQVKQIVDETLEKLPEEFNILEMMGKVEERTPYVIVAFQECQRMNFLTSEMKRSLKELELGLKVNCEHQRNILINVIYLFIGRIDYYFGHGRLGNRLVFRSNSIGMDESSLSVSPWTRGVVF
jgi:hypothetical protein